MASAVAAPRPEMKPDARPSANVRRMHSTPIGPTGAAIEKPMMNPRSKKLMLATPPTTPYYSPPPPAHFWLKFSHVFERKTSICKAIPLLDDFGGHRRDGGWSSFLILTVQMVRLVGLVSWFGEQNSAYLEFVKEKMLRSMCYTCTCEGLQGSRHFRVR